jgi:ankyrin repeat protein
MEFMLVADDFGDDWSWLDLGLITSHESPAQSPDKSLTQSIAKAQEDTMKLIAVSTESNSVFSEMDAQSPFEEMQALKSNNFHDFDFVTQEQRLIDFPRESSTLNATSNSLFWKQNTEMGKAKERSPTMVQHTTIDEWILPDFGMKSMRSEPPLSHLPAMSTVAESISPRLDTPEFVVEDYDLTLTNPRYAASPIESHLALFGDQTMADNIFPGVARGTEGRLPIGGRPSRDSITSLDKRLPECSQSCIEDIVSILERHTIGGSSVASSSARTSHISSKKSSRVFLKQSDIERNLSLMDEPPLLPVRVKPPNVFPGHFHVYCAAQMNQNKLRHCRHDGLPCEHKCPDIRRFFTSHIASKIIIYNRVRSRDISEIDQFGNSILHIAASFCAPIPYIIKLIKQKANINATNAAGETFLHLLYAPNEEDDVCSLLEFLSIQRFNFGQHDQHGQTSLHLITRPWLPQHYLVKVIRKIQSLGFVLPTSRDNLGFTILRQMKHLGTQVLGFDPGQEMAFRLSLGLTCETQGYIVRPHNPSISVNSTFNGNGCIHDGKQKFVHNLDDLRRYEHHADLLRTIIKAGDRPWYEDTKGRNGLHCLAEVAFDLPLPENSTAQNPSPQDHEATNRNALRETYLEGLIAAGVNPNNYDKKGNTPLMSFLIYKRTGEDDGATISILNKLLSAKADIHRRNRRGETALHLAIKSGRLGATNLLLRKGANVHARNKKGSGILKVGTEACKKATQDEALYARIMLCMDAAMRAGAVASPTIVQEWSLEGASQPIKI